MAREGGKMHSETQQGPAPAPAGPAGGKRMPGKMVNKTDNQGKHFKDTRRNNLENARRVKRKAGCYEARPGGYEEKPTKNPVNEKHHH